MMVLGNKCIELSIYALKSYGNQLWCTKYIQVPISTYLSFEDHLKHKILASTVSNIKCIHITPIIHGFPPGHYNHFYNKVYKLYLAVFFHHQKSGHSF